MSVLQHPTSLPFPRSVSGGETAGPTRDSQCPMMPQPALPAEWLGERGILTFLCLLPSLSGHPPGQGHSEMGALWTRLNIEHMHRGLQELQRPFLTNRLGSQSDEPHVPLRNICLNGLHCLGFISKEKMRYKMERKRNSPSVAWTNKAGLITPSGKRRKSFYMWLSAFPPGRAGPEAHRECWKQEFVCTAQT